MILLLFFNVLGSMRAQPQRWNLPFPPQGNMTAAQLGRPAHVFDGVDYDALPRGITGSFKDEECYREQARCLRFVTHLTPVCAYNYHTGNLDPYIDMCDMDKQNCIEMVKSGKNMYGNSLHDRHIFLQGMGKNCEVDNPLPPRRRRAGAQVGVKSALVHKIRRFIATQTFKQLLKQYLNIPEGSITKKRNKNSLTLVHRYEPKDEPIGIFYVNREVSENRTAD